VYVRLRIALTRDFRVDGGALLTSAATPGGWQGLWEFSDHAVAETHEINENLYPHPDAGRLFGEHDYRTCIAAGRDVRVGDSADCGGVVSHRGQGPIGSFVVSSLKS